MDVAAWLCSLGLPEYVEGFLSNHIDEATLPDLSDNDLRELGVSSLGHRKKILAAIARLQGQPSVEASQLTDAPLAAEERRPVTVLFADLCGFTQLSEHVDDEALRSLVASFLAMAESSILRCGGVVDKTIGDAVMAVFGVPVAHDDDVANAARAALAIMAGMAGVSRSCGRELNAHVGLATGEAILTHSLGARTVLGASVNVASRVASAAVAGEILVTDTIARTLRDHFALEERAAFIAKGISEPVKVWLLRSEQESSSQAQLFIGRRTELGQLNAVLEGCRSDGRGVIIHVRGEPGIGKTRLVAEAAAKAERDGFEVVVTHALDFGVGHERQPLRRLVAQLLQFPPNFGQAERASALAQLSHQLGIAPGVSPFLFELADALMDDGLRALFQAVPESSRAHARRTAVLAVVAARARRGPLLVIVEDAHWADEELIEMLSAAGELTGAHPLAIITTARPGGDRAYDALRGSQHGVPLVTLDLGPMRAEDALELANTAEDVSDLVRRRCLERSAGNPLYLEQLLRNAEELTHSDVPASLRGLILARVDRLPAPDKRALHAAAILGQRFDSDALSHLLGTSSFDPSNLTRTGLLKAGSDGLAFGHALIRDAVLRSLLAEQRRSLHARAAQWYAQRDLILHAAHLHEAGDPGAAAAFRRAAEDRLARYRSPEALELVDRGLACSDGESEAPRLMLLKAENLLECGRASDAATAFRATIDLGPEATIECRCRLGLAAAYRIIDDIELALAELDRAEELAHEIERHDLLSQCHHLRGNLLFPTGRMQECWTEHQLALEAAEQAGDPEAKARALGGLGDAEYVLGHMLKASSYYRRCTEESVKAGLGRIEAPNRAMAAMGRMFELKFGEMLEEGKLAIERSQLFQQPRAEILAQHMAALALCELGRYEEALRHLQSARQLTAGLGAWRFEAENLSFIADIHQCRGERDLARAAATEAVAYARRTGTAYCGAIALAVLARTEDDAGTRRTLLAEIEELLGGRAVSHNHWIARRILIELGWETRDPDLIEAQTSRLESFAAREPAAFTDFVVARAKVLKERLRNDAPGICDHESTRLLAIAHQNGAVRLAVGLS